MQSFDKEDVSIAYIDEGAGEPVLLIHGFASNVATNWIGSGWVHDLTHAGYRVIAYDNRGHGQSAKLYDEALYGAPIMAADARRLLEHLDISRAHVIGYSMGARIAAFLAMRHGECVASTVFAGLGINMVIGIPGARPIAKALRARRIEDVSNPTVRSFRAFADQTGSDREALAACILSAREKVRPEELATIRAPVLIAVGTEDVIAGSARDLAALIPNAEILDIPGRDHMQAVGDKVFKAAIPTFLRRHPITA